MDIRARHTGGDSAEVMLYGYVADVKEDAEDVTAQEFDAALKKVRGARDIVLRINSCGGSVFAGQSMAFMLDELRRAGAHITARIEGVAASMASVIPHACSRVLMSENALLMIHKPSSFAVGNSDDMLTAAEMLEKAENTLVSLYMRRFKGGEAELRGLLREEVWLGASEALEYGLIDEVIEAVPLAACAGGYSINGIQIPAAVLAGVNTKMQLKEGGEKMERFDKSVLDKAAAICDEGRAAVLEPDGEGYTVSPMPEAEAVEATAFLTAEAVWKAAGLEDMDAGRILAALTQLAEAGVLLDDVEASLEALKATPADVLGKAVAYDALVEAAREEALTAGVKAKGEVFDRERWAKALAAFTLCELGEQRDEWLAEAAGALKAGGQVSRVPLEAKAPVVNPTEYEI